MNTLYTTRNWPVSRHSIEIGDSVVHITSRFAGTRGVVVAKQGCRLRVKWEHGLETSANSADLRVSRT